MSGRKTEVIIFGGEVLFPGRADESAAVRDGVGELLDQLGRSKYLLALVSEKVRNEIDAVLKVSGLDGVFDAIVSREDFGGKRLKDLMDFPWKLAFDRLDGVRHGRELGGRKRWHGRFRPYYSYRTDKALVLAGSACEVYGAVTSGMNVVKVGKANSDEGARRSNVDFLVDGVVPSLADLVGKRVHQWFKKE